MSFECHVNLDVFSETHPANSVTEILKILPDEIQIKGEPCLLAKGRVYKEHVGSLKSKVSTSEDLDVHIENLWSQLQGKEEFIF